MASRIPAPNPAEIQALAPLETATPDLDAHYSGARQTRHAIEMMLDALKETVRYGTVIVFCAVAVAPVLKRACTSIVYVPACA